MRRRGHSGKVDANQNAIVAALREARCGVLSLASLGGGVPDTLVWSPYTRSYAVHEVKGPDGELTPDQVTFHAAWPGPIVIVRSVDEALAAVGALRRGSITHRSSAP